LDGRLVTALRPSAWRGTLAAAVLGVGLGLVGGLLGLAGPGALGAGAVGDRGLSTSIIANPVAGWQPEPSATLERVVSYIDGLEADAIVPKGGNALTAVQGWRNPADQSQYVVIALVALRYSNDSPAQVATRTRQAAVAALASLCATGSTQSSVHASTIAAVPDSHTLSCDVKGVTAQPYAAGLARSNVMALILSVQGAVTSTQLASFATSQYAAMPSGGYAVGAAPSSGRSTETTVVELLLGLVVLAAAGFALMKVLQRAGAPSSSTSPTRARSNGQGPTPARPSRGARARVRTTTKPAANTAPVVRRGTVQRPASLAGGIGPPPDRGAITPPPPRS
jgi:hypothetical protein